MTTSPVFVWSPFRGLRSQWMRTGVRPRYRSETKRRQGASLLSASAALPEPSLRNNYLSRALATGGGPLRRFERRPSLPLNRVRGGILVLALLDLRLRLCQVGQELIVLSLRLKIPFKAASKGIRVFSMANTIASRSSASA